MSSCSTGHGSYAANAGAVFGVFIRYSSARDA
ncbi:unnamed protein product [Soboliphyme baturini]|uniref:Uncharacterized protein n=1 Tax=Soboliphyme baturini TaxID=241478 RepID=A0A183J886_9BILA|nr:unnamed protein product [Soboliphyme baturini]